MRQDKDEPKRQHPDGDQHKCDERSTDLDGAPKTSWLPVTRRAVRRTGQLRRARRPASCDIQNSHSHSSERPTGFGTVSNRGDRPIRFRGEMRTHRVKGA